MSVENLLSRVAAKRKTLKKLSDDIATKKELGKSVVKETKELKRVNDA